MRSQVLGLARSAHRWVRAGMLMQRVAPWSTWRDHLWPLPIWRYVRHPLSTARAVAASRRAAAACGFDSSIHEQGGPIAPLLTAIVAQLRAEVDKETLADIGDLPTEEDIAQAALLLEDYRGRLWQHIGWALTVQRDRGTMMVAMVRLPRPVRLVEFHRDLAPPMAGDFVMVRLRFLRPRIAEGRTWDGEQLVLRVELADLHGTGVFVGKVLPPTRHEAHLSGILPGDEILFAAAHIDECTRDLAAWGLKDETVWGLKDETAGAVPRGDRQRPGQPVSQNNAVAGTIETPPACCQPFEAPGVCPGWTCGQCRTYNGLQRDACKHCGHDRCDVAPRAN